MEKYICLLLLFGCIGANSSLFAQTQPDLSSGNPPRFDTLSDWEISGLNAALFDQAKNILDDLETQVSKATATRQALETEVDGLKKDTLTTRVRLDSVNLLLKTARSNEKTLLKQRKQAEKTTQFIDKTVHSDAVIQRKNAPKCWEDFQKLDKMAHPPAPPNEKPIADVVGSQDVAFPSENTPVAPPDTFAQPAAEPREKPVKSKTRAEKPGARYSSYNPAGDVMLNPPHPPCSLPVNVRDEFSGELRKETARTELFRFTNPQLKNYYKDKPHILCEASLAATGPNSTLNLVYTIRDPNARKAFGSVQKNGVAILKFMDGTTFTVYNLRPDEGTLDAGGQVAMYRPQYGIDKIILKKMRTTMLDKIRMAWSTGYEDYDVQQVDILMLQAQCLE